MKKYIYIILFLISIINISASKPDFRQINWGMEQQQIIQSEKIKLLDQNEENLVYSCLINNKNCILMYGFQNKKVFCATYFFKINHTSLNDYLDDYNDLFDSLKIKYQEPISNKMIWKNNLFRNSPSDYGTAISVGHLICVSKWETETTNIMMSLTGDNYQIQLAITYSDKNYVPETPATDDL